MAERLRVRVPALLGGALVLAIAGGVIWFLPSRSPVPASAPPAVPILAPTPAVVEEEEAPDEGIAANPPWTGDLDGMVERRLIRLLVVPSRTDYYLDQGEPKGVTAEYAREFERRLNRRFQTGARPIRVVFVPVVRDDLLPGLGSGKGDIAAANLTITPERRQIVDFSPPIRSDVREIVVTEPELPTLASLEDLAGREILTRRSSSYWDSLEALDGRLRADGLMGLRLQAVLEAVDDEDLLELVASGRLPLAVVDDHKAARLATRAADPRAA